MGSKEVCTISEVCTFQRKSAGVRGEGRESNIPHSPFPIPLLLGSGRSFHGVLEGGDPAYDGKS